MSDTDTSIINITAVNDAPINTLPASFTTNEDTAFKLTGLSVTDVDAGVGTITVTLSVGTGTLTAATAGSVTVTGSGNGSIVLSGTLANINTYLANGTNQPTYTPVANANGTVTLTMTTNDGGNTGGGALSDTDTSIINITAVNDAPVNTVPGAIIVAQNSAFSVTGLSVNDVDAGSSNITVTLTVAHGALTLLTNVSGGLTAGGIGGNNTASVTLTGSQATIDATLAALNGVVYRPTSGFAGSDTLTMLSNDQSNTGLGGALTDNDIVAISVVNPFTLTTGTDSVFYVSGTNQVNGTDTTATNGDILTGGSGTDTLTIDTAKNITKIYIFGDGANTDVGLTNFETLVLTDSTATIGMKDTITVKFDSHFLNNGTLTVDGSALINLTGTNFTVDASAVTSTSQSFVITGSAFADKITGGAGNDILQGGAGNDTIDGGAGAADLISFADASAAITFTLDQSAGTHSTGALAGGLGTDTYSNIEGVIGSAFNDTITGSASNDIIRGGAGNDTLDGAGGTGDLIDFSDATALINFTLIQGVGGSFAAAGLGTDTYLNFEGVIGTNFADTLTGTASADQLRGGGGNDTLFGLAGNDILVGGAGADMMSGGAGSDTFRFFNADASAVDTITDFTVGTVAFGGDVLDISDLLGGAGATAVNLATFVTLRESSGNTIISVDQDGAGVMPAQDIVTLTGVTNLTLAQLQANGEILF